MFHNVPTIVVDPSKVVHRPHNKNFKWQLVGSLVACGGCPVPAIEQNETPVDLSTEIDIKEVMQKAILNAKAVNQPRSEVLNRTQWLMSAQVDPQLVDRWGKSSIVEGQSNVDPEVQYQAIVKNQQQQRLAAISKGNERSELFIHPQNLREPFRMINGVACDIFDEPLERAEVAEVSMIGSAWSAVCGFVVRCFPFRGSK